MEDMDNIVLEHLKAIRGDLGSIKADIAEIKLRLGSIEMSVGSGRVDKRSASTIPMTVT